MSNAPRAPLLLLLLLPAASAVLVACGDSPTAPGRTPPAGRAAPDRIELIAPDAITPGESAPLTLIAYLADGSSIEVTSHAEFVSSNPNVLALIAQGRIRASALGEASISVSYLSLQTARLMFSMRAGTYRLTGRVTDGGQGLGGADVRVMSGAGRGLATTTEGSGLYRLYGVGGDTEVQVRKPDYVTASKMIDIGQHSTLDFELTR
jgi:Carboxypeptidase regulatory-like domain